MQVGYGLAGPVGGCGSPKATLGQGLASPRTSGRPSTLHQGRSLRARSLSSTSDTEPEDNPVSPHVQVQEMFYDKGAWNVLFELDLEADGVQKDALVGDVVEFLTVRQRLEQVAPMIDGEQEALGAIMAASQQPAPQVRSPSPSSPADAPQLSALDTRDAGRFGKINHNGGSSSSRANVTDAVVGLDCCAPEVTHSSCQASADMQHAEAQTMPVIMVSSGDSAESVEAAARCLAAASALAKQASLPDIPYLNKRSSTHTRLDSYSSSSSSPRSSLDGTPAEPETPKLPKKTEPAGPAQSAGLESTTKPRKAASRSHGSNSSSATYGLVLGFLVGTVLAIMWTLVVTLPPGKLQHSAGPCMMHYNQQEKPNSYISQVAIRSSLSTAGSFLQQSTASLSSSGWEWLQHPGILSAANSAWRVSNAAANTVRHAAAVAAAKPVCLLRLYPSTSAASGSSEMGSVLGQIQQELAVWQAAMQAAHAAGPTAQQAQQQLQMAQSLLHLLQRATAEAKTHTVSVSTAASTAQEPPASLTALPAPSTGLNTTLQCTDNAAPAAAAAIAPAVSAITCPAASLYVSRPGVIPAVCGNSLAITHTALTASGSAGEDEGLPWEVCPAVSAAQGTNATAAAAVAAPSWTDSGYGECPAAFNSLNGSARNSTADTVATVLAVYTSPCHLPLLPVAVCSSQPSLSDITCSAQGSMEEVVSFLQQLAEAAAATARLEPLVCFNNSTTSLEHMLQQVAAAAADAAAAAAAAVAPQPVAAMPQDSAAAAADSAPGTSRHCECVCVDVVTTTAPVAGAPSELDRPATVLGKKMKRVLGYLQQTFSPEALELMLAVPSHWESSMWSVLKQAPMVF